MQILWAASLLGWMLVSAPLSVAGQARSTAGGPWGVRPDGRPVARLAARDRSVVLLFFVATDCPISNRTFPEMRRLREEFAGQGVPVWFVYPNEGQGSQAVEEHQRAFDAGGEAVLDVKGRLTQLAGAIVTPEAAVLQSDGHGGWKPVYVGRVDDRYVRLGLERPVATEHFGEEAVRAALAGRTPKPDPGRPVGCAIVNRGWQTGGAAQ